MQSVLDRPGAFEAFVVSPAGVWDPGLAIAASRAGGVGLLDLTFLEDAHRAGREASRLARLARGKFGVVLHARIGEVEAAALETLDGCDSVLFVPEEETDLEPAVLQARRVAARVGVVCTSAAEARLATSSGADFLVAKGHEAGGRVGSETCFVLLQRFLGCGRLPVVAWGGIGLHTAAACRVAGALGVVLDWQLALTRESPLPGRLKSRIASMDGSETAVVEGPGRRLFRLYSQPGMTARDRLVSLVEDSRGESTDAAEWDSELRSLISRERLEDRAWPVSQDAAFASAWRARARSVAGALSLLRTHTDRQVRACAEAQTLARGSSLARSHGTEFPVVQGPMTRVSDVPEFIEAVASGGGLPFVALALMRRHESRRLLERTGCLLGNRPWGVGILGFVSEEIRAEQLEVIREIRPRFAIIAGGRPDQAAALEEHGIQTYLHVPSPEMLRMFLREGARRFIFEGSECGGHVGPRTSFVLWDSMIEVLLEAAPADDRPESPTENGAERLHVLFAGGIHDALSASMVTAAAQPLVERSMNVGVLMGSAYLFTEEITRTGAVVGTFQDVALEAGETVLLTSGPGHAIRCAATAYTDDFDSRKRELLRKRLVHGEVRDALEGMNVGRLRIASKGLTRPESTSGPGELTCVDADEQRRLGMYMMGQVVGLREERLTIRELHEEVCDGALRVLNDGRLRSRPACEPKESDPVPDPLDVAIIGMACLLPGAPDLDAFWHNILSGRDAVGEIPEDRFDPGRWFDPDRSARDKIYSRWGGFLEDVPFDPLKYRIPPAALRSIEPVQLLALEVVDRALRNAGYADENPYRRRTSVILGVGGGLAELGANYTFRASIPQFIENPDASLWDQLPEWTEDSFPGILLNLVAGRVANRFDLGGVNYVIDAACASSLAALYQACGELTSGRSDVVITGGCDTVQNPLGYVCFSKTGALSARGRSRPFDRSADGIAISEGLAVVVLKRRIDAERDGDRIYAVVRGVAGGSDGRTMGVTAPHGPGQAIVVERAYRQAGFSPATLGLVEAHGTGTEVGDRTEFRALSEVLSRHSAAPRRVALGSVKSMIGHTKCAAGMAGLIKATLALYHRVLPPTLHVENPIEDATRDDSALYINTTLRPWFRGETPRRAGVSAFGFGGSNFHAALEEYTGEARSRHLDVPSRRRAAEVVVVTGDSPEMLTKTLLDLDETLTRVEASGREIELADVALTLHRRRRAVGGRCRAAVVASSVPELIERVRALLDHRRRGDRTAPPKATYSSDVTEDLTGDAAADVAPRIAFLFPGQGSQFPGMLNGLAVEFTEVRASFELADEVLHDAFDRPLSAFIVPPPAFTDEARSRAFQALKSTDVAQSALGACGVAVARLLASFGVRPSMVAGHSYGELVALHVAGSIEEEVLYELSLSRGRAMLAEEQSGADLGAMMAVAAGEARTREVIRDCPQVWIANLNGPRQIVLSGSREGLSGARRKLEAAEISTTPLPVACGFHSPFMAPARSLFADVLAELDIGAPRIPVFSNLTTGMYPDGAEEIRQGLADQLVRPVRFSGEIEAMYREGARIFVEVGPHGILSKLVDQILGDRPHLSVATQPKGVDGVTALLHALATLVVHGADVDLDRLYEGRELEILDLEEVATPAPPASPSLWLVNGAYARPASEPRRTPARRAVLERAVEEPARSAQGTDGSLAEALSGAPEGFDLRATQAADSHTEEARTAVTHQHDSSRTDLEVEALQQFQETMRQFLSTQRAVMEAYLGATPQAEAPDAAPRVSTSSSESTPPSTLVALRAPSGGLDADASGGTSGAPPSPSHRENGREPADRPESASSGPGESRIVSLEERLRAIVSERTGYPPDMLEVDTNLEGDLGIDSIKRVEIIGTFRRSVLPDLREPPAWFMEQMGEASTLRQILDGVGALLERHGAPEATSPANGSGAARALADRSSGEGHSGAGSPAPGVSDAELAERLAKIIAERTGYPPEMLELDANLEGDLGIDSIKRVEIIGAFRRSFFPTMNEPPAWFMERMTEASTMRAILDGVAALIRETGTESEVETETDTGLPARGFPAAAPSGSAAPGGGTDENASGRDPLLEPCPRCVARPVACPLPENGAPPLPDGIVLITRDDQGAAEALAAAIEHGRGRAVLVSCEEISSREAARELVEAARREHGPVGALAHLCALRSAPTFPDISASAWSSHVDTELKSLLFLLQAMAPELSSEHPARVLTLTRGAGDFGAVRGEAEHPWRGGLAGLIKTASREWEHAHFRSIDVDETPAPELLLRELAAEGPVEIGYRGGTRSTVVASAETLPDGASVVAPLGESDVVLVTGGARGITAQIAQEIALRTRATMILLGRSTLPLEPEDDLTAGMDDPIALRQAIIAERRRNGESVAPRQVEARLAELLRAREIRQTLAAIEAAGAAVEYRRCDARDPSALTRVVEDITKTYGGIDAVVHGAGVIEDRLIVDKDPPSFDRVIGTKLDPLLTLTEALDRRRLRLMVLFSSVAGFYGNPGQGDYAAANEMLNRLARRFRDTTSARVVAINWGPWMGTGMVSPEVAKQFEERGIGMVTIPHGRRAAWREIEAGSHEDAVVILGPGPWVKHLKPTGRGGVASVTSPP